MTMYATKIKMKSGCFNSQSLLEIDEIYIEGANEEKFYQKAIIRTTLGEVEIYVLNSPRYKDFTVVESGDWAEYNNVKIEEYENI